MKKVLAFMLAIAIAVSLCACGKVNQTMELITAIGEVTLQSGDSIAAAEEAYAELNEKEQAKVENYTLLQDARSTYNRITDVANTISAIGDVTLESEAAIVTAEEAYASLSTAEQALIENYNLVAAAKVALEEARFEAYKDSLAAKWVPELNGNTTIVLTRFDKESATEWDGEWVQTVRNGSEVVENSGTWKVVRETNFLTFQDVTDRTISCPLIEEDGFTKLVAGDSTWFTYTSFCFVREEDYDAAFDQKFLSVELNGENYAEYLEGPIHAGYALSADGEPNMNMPIYIMKSKLNEQGYVYLDTSDDFIIDIIYEENFYGEVSERSNPVKWHLFEPINGFAVEEDWIEKPVRLGNKTTGTAYFIKAEYVTKNYCDTQYFNTYVLTTNGTLYNTGIFNAYTFSYEDYLR